MGTPIGSLSGDCDHHGSLFCISHVCVCEEFWVIGEQFVYPVEEMEFESVLLKKHIPTVSLKIFHHPSISAVYRIQFWVSDALD